MKIRKKSHSGNWRGASEGFPRFLAVLLWGLSCSLAFGCLLGFFRLLRNSRGQATVTPESTARRREAEGAGPARFYCPSSCPSP